MSYDFSLLKACTHEVCFEISAASDEGIVKFVQPPASARIRVHIDGEEIPPGGLFSHAEIPFSRPGPYRIATGVNDLLLIKVGNEAPRYIQLLPGPSVSASDVAVDLQRKLPQLIVTVKNRRVVLRSRTPGAFTAFSFPDPRWTDKTASLVTTARILGACEAVGIVPGRYVYGQKIFPGWSVEGDRTSNDGAARVVRFEYPLANAYPMVQLSYVTISAFCRRCQGSRFEYDYTVMDGTYESVADLDLLLQEFDKFLFTRAGSHWKWPWLGSGLIDRIGGKGSTGATSVSALVQLDISNAFMMYQSIKNDQDQKGLQRVTDAEFPMSLGGISVREDKNDPTIVYATTSIVSRSRNSLTVSRVVGNPDPFSLFRDPRQIFRMRG